MAYVALGKALYDYVAQAEDELNLTEDDYLYILESDDPEWWKAKLRRLDEQGNPIQDDTEERAPLVSYPPTMSRRPNPSVSAAHFTIMKHRLKMNSP